jgi:hypothetical protein
MGGEREGRTWTGTDLSVDFQSWGGAPCQLLVGGGDGDTLFPCFLGWNALQGELKCDMSFAVLLRGVARQLAHAKLNACKRRRGGVTVGTLVRP